MQQDSGAIDLGMDDEDDAFIEENKLSQAINKLRRMYTNTIMTGEGDRIAFETILNDIDNIVSQHEQKRNAEIDLLRTEMSITNRERDMKLKDWRQRYEKLQNRWSECMADLDNLQREKEELRKQRDDLLLNRKSKQLAATPQVTTQPETVTETRTFFLAIMKNMLEAMIISLNAEAGTIFVYDQKEKNLVSLVLTAPTAIMDENSGGLVPVVNFPDVIHAPSKAGKSIAGTAFQTGDCLNILDTQRDERLFKAIDEATGYRTKAAICFPIFSVKNNNVIGVIEIINKKNEDEVFSVQDEARMAEYTMLVSHVMDTQGLKDIGFQYGETYGSAASMTDEQEEPDTESKQPLKRMASYLQVKRTKLKSTRSQQSYMSAEDSLDDDISVVSQKPKTIVPKDIENYIKKLEMCWRKAVGESAQLQNRIVSLERDLHQKHTFKFNVEKNIQELNSRIASLEKELMKVNHEANVQKEKWQKREVELKNDLELAQRTNQKLFVEQAKSGNEEIVKNVIVSTGGGTPINKSVNLPYIDLKSQRKKIVLNLTDNSSLSARTVDSGVSMESNVGSLTNTSMNKDKDLNGSGEYFTPTKLRAPMRDLFLDVFVCSPCAMCILNKSYRVWRANDKFCDMLDCTEQTLLGLMLSDITIGLDLDALPRLLQFDVIQGLGLCKPKPPSDEFLSRTQQDAFDIPTLASDSLSKSFSGDSKQKRIFFKVNVQISTVGPTGQKYQTCLKQGRGVVKSPFYILSFSRQAKPPQTAK